MENFIPFRRRDVIDACAAEDRVDAGLWHSFAALFGALLHHRYHELLERLKDNYSPFNPDRDTVRLREWSDAELDAATAALVDDLRTVIEAGNFQPLTEADLKRALDEESLFKVRLHVDFEDFEEVLFFARGESVRHETLVEWFGLRRRRIEFVNFDRVVVYVRFRDAAWFESRGRGSELPFAPGSTMLKLFQNVPRADLEMLFPNTEVRMKTIDKVVIGVPAAVTGLLVLTTKMGATLLLVAALVMFWLGLRDRPVVLDQAALVALASGLGALAGYLWKQFSTFKNRKIRFMKALADSLYFKNLDNNVGVFHRLVDAAEEEDAKEALLAYYFLLTRGAMGAAQLDRTIETWFAEQFDTRLDFEIEDALGKLVALELVTQDAAGDYAAVPLIDARARLDAYWDGLYEFSRETSAGASAAS